MKRNMKKIASETEGKIPDRYSITFGECMELSRMIGDGKKFDAICMAFNYGFALALRYEKNRRRRGATA